MSILDYVNNGAGETNKELDNNLMRKRNDQMKEYAKKFPETLEFIESVIETMDVKEHPLSFYMAFGVIFMDFMGYDIVGSL